MSFLDTVRRAKSYLEEQGRVSLRALKREFELEDDALEALVEELVEIQQIAVRDGKALAWARRATPELSSAQRAEGERRAGPRPAGSTPPAGPSEKRRIAEPERAPRDYTPKHLADKILRSKSALEGERKQVTILFADVKGSM
jgi:hypothetical protein